MTPETPQEAYTRGMEVGRTDMRLNHHDELIDKLTATLTKAVNVQATLTLAVAALDAARIADRDTRIETAKVLKDTKEQAEATARSESEKAAAVEKAAAARAALGWSPITRVFAVVAAMAIVFNLYQSLTTGLP